MTLSAVCAVTTNLIVALPLCCGAATLRTRQLFADGLLNHYRSTLRDIPNIGYLVYWTNEFRPYLRAAADQFSTAHQLLTERLLKKRAQCLLRSASELSEI